MSSRARTRFRYAPALDGLRGIAMVGFMAFHLGVSALIGSWIGINLFFVLSGFLIVRLLVTEVADTGRLNILAFYRRRARRLLPALFVLLATLCGYGLLFASAETRAQLRGDLLATLFYVMNWRLIATGDQYFTQFGQPSFLQHAWTLAVEEQFYLLVPLLVLLLVRWCRTSRAQATWLLGLAALSALYAGTINLQSASGQALAYYGTPARAQSLLVGAAAGWWFAGRRGEHPRRWTPPVLAFLGWGGLAFFVIGFLTIAPFAGWMFGGGGMLLSSVLAGGLVVACADPRPALLTRLLGWTPLAYLGRISYGLYLWHWPVHLWLYQVDRSMAGPLHLMLGMAITLAIAVASYELLERRVIRYGLGSLVGARRARYVAIGTTLALIAGSMSVARGATAADGNYAPRLSWVADIPPLVPGQPAYRKPAVTTRVAVYGDSVPYLLQRWYPDQNFPGLQITGLAVPGCDLLESTIVYPPPLPPPAPGAGCSQLHRDLQPRLAASGARQLVVFASPLLAFRHRQDGKVIWWDDAAYRASIAATFDHLLQVARTDQVGMAVVTVPCRKIDEGASAKLANALEADPPVLNEATRPTRTNTFLKAWAATNKVPVIDLATVTCGPPVRTSVHGIDLFGDGIHFARDATPMVWGWLAPKILALPAGAD